MGLAESALLLLGVGIVSSRFKAGAGLGELGTGIQTLVAAPLTGTGMGLGAFAGGLRDLAEAFGDIGRGIAAIFGAFPKSGNGYIPPLNGNGQQQEDYPNGNGTPPPITNLDLKPDSGGSAKTLLAGGGGNVPNGPVMTLEIVGSGGGAFTGTQSQHISRLVGYGFTQSQAYGLVHPHFNLGTQQQIGGNLV